ncbi:putative XRE-type DNA-binding protein [Arthrobacter sp. GAS37]|uniref:hypothetical protein n=1 Tax=Arthrobacter sp. GAS37 TaxID=3156261 RepID=UPI003836B7D9
MGELEADEAAQLAGMTRASFLTRMSQLNGTPFEFRLPKQPGRRARLYDEDRVREWIAAGRPAPPSVSTPVRTDASTVQVEASYDGASWVLSTKDGETASADTLNGASEQLRILLARSVQGDPGGFKVRVHFDSGNESVQKWEESRRKREQAAELRKEATRLAHEACAHLSEQGISQTDIALLFGVSRTVVQRALSGVPETD